MKKVISLVMAIALVMCLAIPTFAGHCGAPGMQSHLGSCYYVYIMG